MYAKLGPQVSQVYCYGLRSHLSIEFHERSAIRRLIADFESALEGPISLNGPTRAIDRAQSLLEPFGSAGPLPDFNVGHQAKERAAPIGSSPCMRVVESAIAGLRQSLRHIS